MKAKMSKLGRLIGDLPLRAAVWAQTMAPSTADMRTAARAGTVGALLAAGLATAQTNNGIITGITNATTTVKAIIAFISILGVLVGLAFMFSAATDMYKKHNDQRNDITWGGIVAKAVAGAVSMALVYFGTQFVLTLGGSNADIGRTLQ